MKIRYLGHSCFQITAKSGTTILTDPYTKVGYELPMNLWTDIITVSHAHFDHNYTQATHGKVVINKTGKYSFNHVHITGIKSWHDEQQGALRGENIIFKMKIDGMTVCHLGDLGEPCTAELLEAIGNVDILLLPIGGTYTIDAMQAKEYADRLAPKKIIPMHFRPTDGTLDIAMENDFLTLYQAEEIEKVSNGEIHFELENLDTGKKIIFMERVKV